MKTPLELITERCIEIKNELDRIRLIDGNEFLFFKMQYMVRKYEHHMSLLNRYANIYKPVISEHQKRSINQLYLKGINSNEIAEVLEVNVRIINEIINNQNNKKHKIHKSLSNRMNEIKKLAYEYK